MTGVTAPAPQPNGDVDRLVHAARNGDVQAFTRLVELQYPFVFRTAFRWLGNRSDAEDVAQTVCMKLAQALGRFDGRSAFSTWLYRVTLNAVRDLQRAHQRVARQADALELVVGDQAAPAQEDRLRVADLWRVVRQLPEKQRDAVLLVYAEQLSQAEAAVVMNCKEATVAWHIHMARKALRDRL